MKKLVFAILSVCSCLIYVACGPSLPVTGSCSVSDSNGQCCIESGDCSLFNGNPEIEFQSLADSCIKLDPLRKPLFCINDFADCIPLIDPMGAEDGSAAQKVELCMGTDSIWNSREIYSYNIFCCK